MPCLQARDNSDSTHADPSPHDGPSPHAGPSPHDDDGGSPKAFQEEIAEIEQVLQQVRLSWKEAEFRSSVAEMEDENTHMKTLLQSLTNYSNVE